MRACSEPDAFRVSYPFSSRMSSQRLSMVGSSSTIRMAPEGMRDQPPFSPEKTGGISAGAGSFLRLSLLVLLKPFADFFKIDILPLLDLADPSAHLEPAQFGARKIISAQGGDRTGNDIGDQLILRIGLWKNG